MMSNKEKRIKLIALSLRLYKEGMIDFKEATDAIHSAFRQHRAFNWDSFIWGVIIGIGIIVDIIVNR